MANIAVEVVISAKDQASAVLSKFSKTAESAGEQLTETFRTGGLAAGIFLGALAAVGKTAVDVASNFEQSRVAFETMLGSAELAGKTLKNLSDFAKTTPFEFPELVTASQRLLAYNVSAEDLIPTLTMLGNISAGVGRDKLPQLILAFGQVKAATVLTGAELRQFSEAGVPLLDALAKQFKVTAGEVQEMIKDKRVGFEEVELALESLTTQGGKFFNLMDKQSKTFGGTMSNLRDQITRSLLEIVGISVEKGGEIREGSLFAVLKQSAETFLAVLDEVTPKLVAFTTWISQNQTALAAIGGAIGGALVLALGALVVAFGAAIATLGAFMVVGAGLAVLIQQLVVHWGAITTAVTNAWEAIKTFFVDTIPTTIGQVVQSIFDWFSQIPGFLQQTWIKTWTQDVPAAWGFLVGYLSVAIPKFITDWFNWMNQLPVIMLQIFAQILGTVIQKVTEMTTYWITEVKQWPGKWLDLLKDLPTIVWNIFEAVFNNMKENLNKQFSLVSDIWGKIKGIFDDLRNAAESAWSAVQRGFEAGKQFAGGRQAGGIVPGARDEPRMVLAHGQEEIVPVDRRGSSGSGAIGGMSLTVNVGIYAGSETEKRNIARELYSSLTQLAAAENKTVAEMMGR